MSDTADSDQSPAKRPFQYSLRSLLVVTALVAVLLGLIAWLGYGGVFFSLLILIGIAAYRRAWRLVPLSLGLLIFTPCLAPPIGEPREPYRRIQCMNNVKQLGVALRAYHDAYGSFPPAYVADKKGRPMHSWRVLILPFLDQGNLYKRYRFDEPWDGPNNRKLADEIREVYRCPSVPARLHRGETSYVAIVGRETAWHGDRPVKDSEIRDGLSTTILLVEIRNSGIHWMEPRDLTHPSTPTTVNPSGSGISSYHIRGAYVLFADGHVVFLRENTIKQPGPLLTIDGGEKIDEADY